MPLYTFSNKKNEIRDFFFESAAVPSIGTSVKIARTNWTRLPNQVNAATDTRVDPFDKQKFLEKTNKAGKMGDVFDFSRELHEGRKKQTGGVDEIKDRFIEKSKKRRNGKFIE